jgi:Holliday junction DNA helicase RuvA
VIAHLNGTLVSSQPTRCVIDIGGVGFDVNIPVSTFDRLPKKGEKLFLMTHMITREDGIFLYGFATHEEIDLFRLLIGVSKIGPKVALGILSGIPVKEFKSALINGDAKRISLVPGIGKKTAERLILELKEKIPAGEAIAVDICGDDLQKTIVTDTILALVSLGYTQQKAQQAVRTAVKQFGTESMAIEKLVKQALKVIE